MKIYFHETLRLRDLATLRSWQGQVFRANETFCVRQIFRFYRPKCLVFRSVYDGDLQKSPGIRKWAYEEAIKRSNELIGTLKFGSNEHFLKIDLELIGRKLMVEGLFRKYYFYGMASQFASEHPELDCKLMCGMIPKGMSPSVKNLKITSKESNKLLSFLVGLLLIPAHVLFFYHQNKVKKKPSLENAIICQVDGKKSYNMYNKLFGDRPNVFFVIEKQYLANKNNIEYFEIEEANNLGFIIKGLDRNDLLSLMIISFRFIQFGIINFKKLYVLGSFVFELYEAIARGILQNVRARHSVYLTYEHLFLPNAVRNELLRKDNNLSISFPYGMQVESHFFASGYQYNYDILCSSGKLQEQVYKLQAARTKIVLPLGSYEANREIGGDNEKQSRIANLINFKAHEVAITILSSGFQDETYSGEIRLIELAKRLSYEEGVKVIIRPKPLPPPEQYKDAMAMACSGSKSIYITGSDYSLSDFIGVSDLFITFQSHSAADICALGGEVFCINFMGDDPFALWQSAVDGIYLDSSSAFETIMAWVRDEPSGQRELHKRRIEDLSNKLSYKFDDFENYHTNLLARLNEYLPDPSR